MSAPIHAQQLKDSHLDSVHIFNEACYSKLPNIKAIEDLAVRFAWDPIGSEDLSLFSNVDSPDLLKGWDMRLEARMYRIGVVQSAPTDAIKTQYPDFASGTFTSCTLILDGQDDADATMGLLDELIAKEPISRAVAKEGLFTTTWHGGNESFKVFVFYQSDNTGSANLVTVSLLAK